MNNPQTTYATNSEIISWLQKQGPDVLMSTTQPDKYTNQKKTIT